MDLQALAEAPAEVAKRQERTAPRRSGSARLAGAVALLGAIGGALVAGFLIARLLAAPAEPAAVTMANLELTLGEVAFMADREVADLAVSPDSRTLVFSGLFDGGSRLYRVDLIDGRVEPIAGTENGISPFFSPDGRWLGFHSMRRAAVMKLSLRGGSPTIVAPVPGMLVGAQWRTDDQIVFALNNGGLRQVSADGGEVREITALNGDESRHLAPQLLPGEERVLFNVLRGQEAAIEVLDLESGERTEIGIDGGSPFYVPGTGGVGYLVYRQNSMMVATPFDPVGLELMGVPVELFGPVGAAGSTELALAAHRGTAGGVLVYSTARPELPTRLVWVGSDGEVVEEFGLPERLDRAEEARIDAAGRIVSYLTGPFVAAEIGIRDRSSGDSWELAGGGDASYVVPSPDGEIVAYGRDLRLALRATDGSDEPRWLLADDEIVSIPGSWSPDGRTIYFYKVATETLRDIWRYDLDSGRAEAVIATEDDERTPIVSPDGRWLAYVSDALGGWEIMLLDLSANRPARQVSRDGGASPYWSADGRRLYFRSDDGYFTAVDFDPDTGMTGPAERLFVDRFQRDDFRNTEYAVDGEGRFLLTELIGSEAASQLRVFVGFDDWLRERVSDRQ